jgi:hypothetical protein
MAIALDTHLIYKDLMEAGFNAKQAEAIKSGMLRVQQSGIENLATKEDLAKLEINFLKWGVGIAFAIIGLTVTLVKLLP